MAVNLSPLAGAGWQFFDNNGVILSGGLLYTYAAGTTTPQATYTSSSGATPNANPIVLNSAGRTSSDVWLTAGQSYKFVLKTSTGTTLGTYDNLSGVNDVYTTLAASGGSALIGYLPLTGPATTVQARLRTLDAADATFALKGANADITSLANIQSVNGGQLAGLRNRVINGQGWISQRGNVAVTGNLLYGPDRMMASIAGSATGISGNITSLTLAGANSNYGWGIVGSWTNGAAQLAQRIESWNVKDMNSKTVTFSGKLYQDTGGSRTFSIIIQKPTALDNFTSTTTIASTTVSVPTGVTTSFTFTTTLGASDATNGIMLTAIDTVANTVTSKTYFTSDWQFEIGPVATTYEQRPYGMELALCQFYSRPAPLTRYAGYVAAAQSVITSTTFPTMRIAPVLTGAAYSATNITGTPALSNFTSSGCTFSGTATSAGPFDIQVTAGYLSSEI
jgi:hypothetical protein